MAKPVVSFGLLLKVLSMVVLLFITSTWSSPVGVSQFLKRGLIQFTRILLLKVNNFVAGPPLTDEELSSAPPIIIKTSNLNFSVLLRINKRIFIVLLPHIILK